MDLELPHSCQIWKESLKRFDLKGKFIPPLAEAVTNCIRKTKKKRSLESEYRYLSHYRNSVKYCFPQHFTEIRQSGNWRCWVMATNKYLIWWPSAILNFKKCHIWSRLGYGISYVLLCIKIHQNRMRFEICRFNDFQDGGRTPCRIFKRLTLL